MVNSPVLSYTAIPAPSPGQRKRVKEDDTHDTVIRRPGRHRKLARPEGLTRHLSSLNLLIVNKIEVAAHLPAGFVPSGAAQCRTLQLIPGTGARVTDLADRLGVTKQSLGRTLTALESHGLVATSESPDRRDRRVCARRRAMPRPTPSTTRSPRPSEGLPLRLVSVATAS